MMNLVRDRIDDWEGRGLIDAATAGRLRTAEAAEPAAAEQPADVASAPPPRSAISSAFGPVVTVAEMFGYLGVGFLLGGWTAAVARIAGEQADVTTVTI